MVDEPVDVGRDDLGGVSRADLVRLRRELFADALEVARHDFDPATRWEAFVEAAWREAGLAFGFLEREQLPEVERRPADSEG